MALLERDDLLGSIATARQEAGSGSGRLVLVRGEAGAGKTSLVRAALDDADARWGWCEPLTVPRPLGPFRDLLVVGEDGAFAVGERLLTAMRDAPTVLVVEDAHWIDDAAADVLRYLGRRVEDSHGLLIVTFRDEVGPEHPLTRLLGELPAGPSVVRLTVPPLSPDAVAGLLSGSGRDVALAWRVTQGNAFLVDQLVRSPEHTEAVRDAVAARVARLTPSARELVRTLSVVPRRVPTTSLPGDVDEAVRAGLLEESGESTGFRHELVRLAVEAGLAPHERRRAHGDALARAGEPAVLAFHARAAGLTERAHRLELEAADQARRAGAHRQAAAHLRRAAADPPGPPEEQARLWLAVATEERMIGRDDGARDAVAAATSAAGPTDDVRLRAELLQWRSRLSKADEDGERLAHEVVELLRPLGPTTELARALAALANVQMVARDLDRAVATGTEAIALAEAVGDAAALGSAQQAVGSARTLAGDDGSDLLLAAVRTADEAGIDNEAARAWSNLVSASGEVRRYSVVADAVPAALAYCGDRDLDGPVGYTRAWQARCLFEQGRWPEATTWVDEVLAGSALADITRITALCTQGRIRARRGDPQVWPPLDEALAHARVTGSVQRIAPVAAGRAEARWLAGAADDGTDGLAEAHRLARRRHAAWPLGELTLWLHRHGLPVTPDDVERSAEPYRLQLTGQPREAGDAWEALGCPYEAADAWVESFAEADVRRGLDRAHELGAGPLARVAARRLRELGVRSVPRGPREAAATHPDGLTAREQEVLDWLRDGHTDAEIAAALHLSVKTVGHHVSAVLRKSGVASRRELRS